MATRSTQYDIGGMSCSFCVESIRKTFERTEGVEDVNVSLAHEEVRVTYDDAQLGEVDLKDALRGLGYTIRDSNKQHQFEEQQAELEQAKRRLGLAGAAAIATASMMLYMIFVMDSFESQSGVTDMVTLGLALGTMFGPGLYILEKAYYSFRRRILNQHVLLEAGAFAGLFGGLLGLFVFPGFPTVHFFAVSVFITTYHILSEYTSLIVRTRASRAVQGILDLQPDTARRVTEDRQIEEVDVGAVTVGDYIRVKPGERIPVDGTIVEGESAVDESVATGEPVPIDKAAGDDVVGGSVTRTGSLLVEVAATGDDAFLNRVAHEIEAARSMKPGVVQLTDHVLQYFVPSVLGIAAVSFLFWMVVPSVATGSWLDTVLGQTPSVQRATFAALAVLVLGYPCALGMATPLALIRGGGIAANNGILLRSGDAFQVFQDVDTIVLDKTGTITRGEPAVETVVATDAIAGDAIAGDAIAGDAIAGDAIAGDAIAGDDVATGATTTDATADEGTVLRYAATAEAFSEHPLADAILDAATAHGIDYPDPDDFESVTGRGVRASLDGAQLLVGKPEWLASTGVDLSPSATAIDRLRNRGQTVVCVAVDGELVGLIGIGDPVKTDARETVERIQAAGFTPVLMTGDTEQTGTTVAAKVGIERVLANVLPGEKRDEIRRLQDRGARVVMVGDGINDAPALTQADVGIAIGAGTDIAIESADVVLMGERLGGVMDAFEIGRASYGKTKQNLVAAFSFNGVGVAAATTGLVHPVFAMIAMVLSVTVVLANSFAGQLLPGEALNTDFSIDADSAD